MTKYCLNIELAANEQHADNWRCYYLVTSGNSLAELLENAMIDETDGDCFSVASYPLEEASEEMIQSSLAEIECLIREAA